MKMTFRWYGENSDHVTLKQIRQIPGCSGIMGMLDQYAAGEVWPLRPSGIIRSRCIRRDWRLK